MSLYRYYRLVFPFCEVERELSALVVTTSLQSKVESSCTIATKRDSEA
jgi:hypothetical protein